jgi:hypothetical protein
MNRGTPSSVPPTAARSVIRSRNRLRAPGLVSPSGCRPALLVVIWSWSWSPSSSRDRTGSPQNEQNLAARARWLLHCGHIAGSVIRSPRSLTAAPPAKGRPAKSKRPIDGVRASRGSSWHKVCRFRQHGQPGRPAVQPSAAPGTCGFSPPTTPWPVSQDHARHGSGRPGRGAQAEQRYRPAATGGNDSGSPRSHEPATPG